MADAPGNSGDTATPSPERQAVSSYSEIPLQPTNLSPDQARVARHVWESTDRVILIRGAAGTGKTHTMKTTIAGIDRPVAVLAPSAEASRGVLRSSDGGGFKDADTVASFLLSEKRQQAVKDGVIWVDEAGLLPIRDLGRLVDVAQQQNARIVLQGDPKQHKSVARHGNMFGVLQEFAGLPVAELKDIRRQRGDYKQAVAAIDKGDLLKAHDLLDGLGYIRETPVFDHNRPLVDDYMDAAKRGSVLVVAPTHKEGDEITAEIRARLKEEGKLGEERTIERLVDLRWTDAEKGDPLRYEGTETLQLHRASGNLKAGSRLRVADWQPDQHLPRPGTFSVYGRQNLTLAVGDAVRATANGWDVTGRHRVNNGSQYTVAGFDEKGNIALSNGWVLPASFGHLQHGYVTTSHAAQGKTVDRVLIAMGHESQPAINAEQFYVSVSRGRHSAAIYTNMAPPVLREAIQRSDGRKSATELMTPKKKRKARGHGQWLVSRARDIYHRLRDRVQEAIPVVLQKEREGYAR